MVKGLRRHSGIRFNLHQLRHNVATAAEEFGYSKAEIAELLGHSAQTVTDRYIDERTKRHRQQLIAMSGKMRELMGYTSGHPQTDSSAVAAPERCLEVKDVDSSSYGWALLQSQQPSSEAVGPP